MKILIADDASGWCEYHKNNLEDFLKEGDMIDVANSANEAYELVYNNMNSPYNIIVTDLQMELDHEPDYAGEWFVKQIKLLSAYKNTKIIIVSATYNIKAIAENLGVDCVPKATAAKFPSVYESFFN